MERVFIGIYPGKKVLDELRKVQEFARPGITGRLIEGNNIHLTLQFIGWIGKKELGEISNNIDLTTKHIEPFSISYKSIGFFPDTKQPRILWVNVYDESQKLTKLHQEFYTINKKYIKERRGWIFNPHLTLARIKSIESKHAIDIVNTYKNTEFGKDRINTISLVKSTLSKTGSSYTVIRQFELTNS